MFPFLLDWKIMNWLRMSSCSDECCLFSMSCWLQQEVGDCTKNSRAVVWAKSWHRPGVSGARGRRPGTRHGASLSQWPLSVQIRPELAAQAQCINVLCRRRPEHQTDNTIIRQSRLGRRLETGVWSPTWVTSPPRWSTASRKQTSTFLWRIPTGARRKLK